MSFFQYSNKSIDCIRNNLASGEWKKIFYFWHRIDYMNSDIIIIIIRHLKHRSMFHIHTPTHRYRQNNFLLFPHVHTHTHTQWMFILCSKKKLVNITLSYIYIGCFRIFFSEKIYITCVCVWTCVHLSKNICYDK